MRHRIFSGGWLGQRLAVGTCSAALREGLGRRDVGVGMAVVVITVLRSIADTYGTTSFPLSDEEHNAKMI
jgi:hypothetical protein